MSQSLIALLLAILHATSVEEYISSQDAAIDIAHCHYSELQQIAVEHEDQRVRKEAMTLVELLAQSDAEEFLSQRARLELDKTVSDHAKVLLFRLITAKNLLDSKSLTLDQYEAYRLQVRVDSARLIFRSE